MIYGVVAEFTEPEVLLHAVREVYATGYRSIHAYTPFPVDELAEALGTNKLRVAPVTLLGGVLGGFTGFFMQWYANVIDYPINVGSRPLNSWPAFIPVTFELTILGASLFAAIGMLAMNGLPRLHHPIFEAPGFDRASIDRFFLLIRSSDSLFDRDQTPKLLLRLGSLEVREVPREN